MSAFGVRENRNAALIGPRGHSQQIASYKYFLKNDDKENEYYLYFGAPSTEISAETTRQTLIAPYGDGSDKTPRAQHIMAFVEKMFEANKAAETIKVFYKKLPWGDLSPSPNFSQTGFNAKAGSSVATETEKGFTLACCTMLPMYDITARRKPRSKGLLKSVAGTVFRAADETPLDTVSPPGKMPTSLHEAPYTGWGHDVGHATPEHDILKMFGPDADTLFASGGVLTIRESVGGTAVSAPFGRCYATSVKSNIKNGRSTTMYNRYMFYSGHVFDAGKGPMAVVTDTGDGKPMVELRTNGGLKRVCFGVIVTANAATAGTRKALVGAYGDSALKQLYDMFGSFDGAIIYVLIAPISVPMTVISLLGWCTGSF